MKKVLLPGLLLLAFVGISLSSCSKDEPAGSETHDLVVAAYNAIVDSISSVPHFIDTTDYATTNRISVMKFAKDGSLIVYQGADNIFGENADVDKYYLTWSLDEEPLSVEDGNSYYSLNISAAAECSLDFSRLVACVDKYGSVDLYKTNTEATKGIFDGIMQYATNLGVKFLKVFNLVPAEAAGLKTGPMDYADWMKNIDDDIPICKLSIPGTHDTYTYVCKASNLFARTQALDIEKQWNLGVRCFDLRIDYDTKVGDVAAWLTKNPYSKLQLTHGALVTLGVSLNSAFNDIKELLKKHDTETAIVILKFDNSEDTPEAIALLDGFLKQTDDSDDGYLIEPWKPGLTLEDARGHMIVIARYMSELSTDIAKPFKFKSDDSVPNSLAWGDNRADSYLAVGLKTDKPSKLLLNASKLFVQDKYEQSDKQSVASYFEQKKMLVVANIDSLNCEKYAGDKVWAFNHLSGYVTPVVNGSWVAKAFMSYSWNSCYMNPFMEDLLLNNPDYKNAYTGVVVVDWAGVDGEIGGGINAATFNPYCRSLPQVIIRHNNNLTYNGRKVTTTDIQ